ncbi:MAG: CPBP family intramembrane metalloprotease [Paludibacteraceae bacterium]|nr:CPBP family intramembrane metalloprotease [Paludibacteraceae bacterium]MBR4840923.1 CPBP family intramembrane metalloprotease [Paludibacteraceae bacterium]
MKLKTILNKTKGYFSNDRYWAKALLILFIPAFFLCLGHILSLGICKIGNISDEVTQIRVAQVLLALFVFICSALLLGFLFSHNPRKLLALKEGNGMAILFCCIAALLSIPLINYITVLNESLIPDSLGYIKELENKNDDIIRLMLENMDIGALLTNIFIMAILPAFSEELFFRGMFLGTIQRSIKNSHICIWITALFFGLIHFQIGKIIPIILMGGLFGYMRVWSKSLWLPIAAHFTNNVVIVLYYFFFKGMTYGMDPENIGTSGTPWILVVCSILLVAILFNINRLAKLGPTRTAIEEEENLTL